MPLKESFVKSLKLVITKDNSSVKIFESTKIKFNDETSSFLIEPKDQQFICLEDDVTFRFYSTNKVN